MFVLDGLSFNFKEPNGPDSNQTYLREESQTNSSILACSSSVQDAIRSGLELTLYMKGLSTQYLRLFPYMHLRFDTG